jgi:hypothetical protein
MARLDEKFANASATAAKNDQYKRLGIIFQDLQETIGVTLLPAIEEFSTYLASPQGQSNLQQIADLFKVIGSIIVDTTKFLLDNIVVIKAVLAAIIFVKLAWGAVAGAVRVYTFVTSLATAQTKLLKVALLSTGIGAIAVAVGVLAESWMGAADAQQTYVDGAPLGPEWDYLDPKKNGFLNPIPEDSDAWLLLGYETYGTYLGALNEAYLADKNKKSVAAKKVEDMGKEIRRALDNEISKMKSTAEKFRDTIGLAFGTFGKDENSVFNIDVVIAKMKRVVAAAKGFTENLKKLREKGVKENTINEIIAMGPAQGNIVAKGLLASGSKLGTFLGLSESLYTTGAGAQAQASLAGNATYEININKAVITASDIIKEIRIYEKKTGRKYLVN